MRKFKNAYILAGVILCGVWILTKPRIGSEKAQSNEDQKSSVSDRKSASQIRAREIEQERTGKEVERLEGAISRSVSSVSSTKSQSAAKTQVMNFGFSNELIDYARLKSKVLLTDAAKAQKEKLVLNVDLLKALEGLLKSAASDPQIQEMRNDAIDLLLDARSAGAGGAAEQVLRAVIEDKQIEDERIDQSLRRTLAGVKAEILYQWSSLEPARSDEIQSWLPGPISEKIWHNVIEAQNQNEMDSREAGN